MFLMCVLVGKCYSLTAGADSYLYELRAIAKNIVRDHCQQKYALSGKHGALLNISV